MEYVYDYNSRWKESEQIDRLVKFRPNSYILEIGSGCGHLAHYLTKAGHTVVTTNAPDDEIKNCNLDPFVEPINWEYKGVETPISILRKGKPYDYIIANGSAMHGESGGPIVDVKDWEFLVNGLKNILSQDGEIWLGFNPSLEWMGRNLEVHRIPDNVREHDMVLGKSVFKFTRSI